MKFLLKIAVAMLLTISSHSWAAADLPPGCTKQIGPGGCQGKSRIESIVITPSRPCLRFFANNCNGGVVEVQNDCIYPLELGAMKIDVKANPPRNSIELFRDAQGSVKAKYSSGNYASYSPSKDDSLSMNGKLGQMTIRIQYVKTKPLCE